FIIVFNEYLVTLFVAPPDLETAPLRVFNLVRTNGLAPSTAALAVTMQLISFVAVLAFFRLFGTRHFKGTYILQWQSFTSFRSASATARRSPSRISAWTSRTASSSRCWDRPAAARRRHCESSPGWSSRPRAA